MLKGVTVSELKDILAKVEPPKRLMDPITELPSEWDQTLLTKIKSAKSIEEIKDCLRIASVSEKNNSRFVFE